MPTVRPKTVVDFIAKNRERMMNSRFNEKRFVEELSDAYDTMLLKMDKRPGTAVLLHSLHKAMVPMSRFKRDYDEHDFAFDIMRLDSSGLERTKKGRQWEIGHGREIKHAFRVIRLDGKEDYYATIRFFDAEQGE